MSAFTTIEIIENALTSVKNIATAGLVIDRIQGTTRDQYSEKFFGESSSEIRSVLLNAFPSGSEWKRLCGRIACFSLFPNDQWMILGLVTAVPRKSGDEYVVGFSIVIVQNQADKTVDSIRKVCAHLEGTPGDYAFQICGGSSPLITDEALKQLDKEWGLLCSKIHVRQAFHSQFLCEHSTQAKRRWGCIWRLGKFLTEILRGRELRENPHNRFQKPSIEAHQSGFEPDEKNPKPRQELISKD